MIRWATLIVTLSLGLAAAGQKLDHPRHPKSGLEITGTGAGQNLRTVFLSRKLLASLPQISTALKPDENFPSLPATGTSVSGVELNVLLRSLSPADPSMSVIAICRDGYAAPFPASAILDHHPILALAIDGLSPHRWALRHHTYDPSPYFITYANFVPSFHLLAHHDFPQHPAEIIRLQLIPTAELFRSITPPIHDLAASDPVFVGFQIAQQNCFRCHNSGDTGGTKANRTWQRLAQVATSRPEHFAAWVHNPQSLDPHAEMPPNLQYDQPTLNALTRYFQTFAP